MNQFIYNQITQKYSFKFLFKFLLLLEFCAPRKTCFLDLNQIKILCNADWKNPWYILPKTVLLCERLKTCWIIFGNIFNWFFQRSWKVLFLNFKILYTYCFFCYSLFCDFLLKAFEIILLHDFDFWQRKLIFNKKC